MADGFIHLSTSAQAGETLARHFADARDLVCLAVDLAMLGQAVRWEHARGGDLFPHLYAALPVNAVKSVLAIPDDGPARQSFATRLAR